jgi:hypothetical protein
MKKSLESGNKNAARLALADPNSKEAKAVRCFAPSLSPVCASCACAMRARDARLALRCDAMRAPWLRGCARRFCAPLRFLGGFLSAKP